MVFQVVMRLVNIISLWRDSWHHEQKRFSNPMTVALQFNSMDGASTDGSSSSWKVSVLLDAMDRRLLGLFVDAVSVTTNIIPSRVMKTARQSQMVAQIQYGTCNCLATVTASDSRTTPPISCDLVPNSTSMELMALRQQVDATSAYNSPVQKEENWHPTSIKRRPIEIKEASPNAFLTKQAQLSNRQRPSAHNPMRGPRWVRRNMSSSPPKIAVPV